MARTDMIEGPDAHDRELMSQVRLQSEELGGHLARRVRRHRTKRRFLGDRELLGSHRSVDLGRADEQHARRDGQRSGRLEQVERAEGVDDEGLLRRGPRVADVTERGQVVDRIGPNHLERRPKCARVAHVDFERGPDDLVALLREVGAKPAADEAMTPGDERAHDRATYPTGSRGGRGAPPATDRYTPTWASAQASPVECSAIVTPWARRSPRPASPRASMPG